MRYVLPILVLAAATFACNSNKAAGDAPVVAAPTTPVAAASGLSGKLLERIDASPYSYLRIQSAAGEVWAAVPETKLEKGADVTVANPMLMTNFESKTLNRKFAQIYFGNLGPAAGAASPAMPAPAAKTEAPIVVGKIEKATGADARTIAEAYAQKGGLKGKTVTIRGMVVKYNGGILGKNWLHLQDGSGDAKSGNNDITITTKDEVAKGQTVTVQGVLNLDKDFGSGYAYSVIVEDAKVVKK
jgi:hypothetical protein